MIDFDDGVVTDVTYALGRLPTRTYLTKSFSTRFGSDSGHPGRYLHRVFDEVEVEDGDGWETSCEVIHVTEAKRVQIEMHIARERGAVRRIRLQKVKVNGESSQLENLLTLDRSQAAKLISVIKSLDSIPVEGDKGVRVDDDLLDAVFSDPGAVAEFYRKDPGSFRAVVESDADAEDIIALRRRRDVVDTMRQWLADDEAFDTASSAAGGEERAWQKLLEDNQWVLGVGLGQQLLTAWDPRRLEQTGRGHNIDSSGKRVDALLRSAGFISSMVFAEIKHHRTELLQNSEYRADCWGPSKHLTGAVVQIQQTVQAACESLGTFLADKSDEGEVLSSGTYLLRPRSYVVVGSLDQLTGQHGGVVDSKFRSFEMFRRNIIDPQIITFDELLARAEWNAGYRS
ncbi:MAG: DUF4263 domain-containing protein, partial [Microthrixaceae bacterium]|nr:DUF4263 domain-containing protein [Microthrixaceae bacterium]